MDVSVSWSAAAEPLVLPQLPSKFLQRPSTSWSLLSDSPLHDLPVRDEILLQYLPVRPDMDVAEVGCGAGFSVFWFAPQVRSYTAVDIAAPLIRKLRAELGQLKNTRFVCADLGEPGLLKLLGRRFDLVYGLDVFEYVHNAATCLRNLASILSPGGMMFLSYPNIRPPRGDGVTWIETRKTLSWLIERAGFKEWEIVEVRLRPWAQAIFGLLHEWPIQVYRHHHRDERASDERPRSYDDTWAFRHGYRMHGRRVLLHGLWIAIGDLMRLFGPVYAEHIVFPDDTLLGRQLLIRAWT